MVRCAYREAGTVLAEGEETIQDADKLKDLVHRLVSRDPHQLFKRLEKQGQEYVVEMKVRLLKQLTSGHKTPPQARQFVSMLLDEYANLCSAAKTLASFLMEFVSVFTVYCICKTLMIIYMYLYICVHVSPSSRKLNT